MVIYMCTLYYIIVLEDNSPKFKIGTMTKREIVKIQQWYSDNRFHNYTFNYTQEEFPEIN